VKIGFICSEYPPGPHGGIGTMTQVLSRTLVQAGHEVRVAGIYDHRYAAPDLQDDQGVKIWRLRTSRHRMGWIPARYRLFQLVRTWVREKSVDVIEVPDYQGLAAGWGFQQIRINDATRALAVQHALAAWEARWGGALPRVCVVSPDLAHVREPLDHPYGTDAIE